MKKFLILLGLTGLFSPLSATAVVLSDGTNIDDWIVYTESQGEITTHNGVLNFTGNGKATGYRLNIDGSSDELLNLDVLSWSMKYSENFTVYVRLTTENGIRYMIYTPREDSRGKSGRYIRIGLGNAKELLNGRWHRIERSLGDDLERFEHGNKIITINRFLIRGSGELDNLELNIHNAQPNMEAPVEDAEDGNITGWRIYSGDVNHATIENIYDDVKGSRVIKLEGQGKGTGYRFDVPKPKGIYSSSYNSALCWDMKASENYTVYLRAETPNGRKYITYTPRDEDRGVSDNYIRMGLGTSSMDGQWHQYCVEPAEVLYRNLGEDNAYLRDTYIRTIFIRGSISIDNIFSQVEG